MALDDKKRRQANRIANDILYEFQNVSAEIVLTALIAAASNIAIEYKIQEDFNRLVNVAWAEFKTEETAQNGKRLFH